MKEELLKKVAENIDEDRSQTITAAEFLHQFTEGTTWAHLDIAGTAFVENNGRMYFGHGATGSGVRLLTHYLTRN